jgi:transcriptional regulator with XRE-family HTH domain
MISKFKTAKEKEKAKGKKPKRKMYSNRIKAILREIGMPQQELSDLTKIGTSHLSRIISGKRQCISLPIAISIAKALGRPVEEVFLISKSALKATQNEYDSE